MTTTPTPPAHVRPARAADLPAIGRLATMLVEVHHAFDPQRFLRPTPRTAAGYAAYIGAQLEAPEATILVAQRNGAVVGYLYAAVEGVDWISLRGPAGIVHDVAVDPGHRGHGIGRLLMEAALAELAARGAPRVLLSTAEGNTGAQRLFAELGFRRTMIEMTREIAAPPPAPDAE